MQRLAVSILGSIVFCLAAAAQTAGTGALAGMILDSSGGGIPQAKITVRNDATGDLREVLTQANGGFIVPLLPPGIYRAEIAKPGFKTTVKQAVTISVTETARLDLTLDVGAVQEQVTVSTEAALLQTESSALGRVTDHQSVSDLPLVARNFTQIVTLSPGIEANVTNASDLGRGAGGATQGNFRAHGAGGADNNFQMNGVQVNDLQASGNTSGGVAIPNPDAIQEFKVQTGLYDASYGRNAGANVNVVTRSGSNAFHGGIFEYFRNNALNANEFFRNRAGQPRGVLKQNQYGMTLGGPMVKEKLLFFVSYQGTRQVNGIGSGGASSFFTPAFTNDRSRAALGTLFAGQPTGAGTVTVAPDGSNISSQALALLNLKLPNGQYAIPTPQSVNGAQPFALRGFSAFSVPAHFREDQFLANLDYVQSVKSRFSGRWFLSDGNQNLSLPPSQVGTSAPGFPQLMDSRMRNLTLSHTYSFSPRLLNQIDFGYHRIGVPTIQQEVFKWSDVGVKASGTANDYPAVGVNGSAALGGNGQGLDLVQNHYTFQDSIAYIRGRHTIHAGGGLTRSQLDLAHFHFFGGLLFLTWPDFMLGLPGGPTANGGNGSSIGNVYLSLDIPGNLDRSWRLTDGNLFVQDDIRVSQSFTLNLGVRYERLENLGDQGGRNSGFDISLANPNPPATGSAAGYVVSKDMPGGNLPAGVKQLGNNYGILGLHQNNVGPRVGWAWRLPTVLGRQTVLRGGYGMYESRATGQPFLQLAAAPPFALLRQLQGAPNASASFASPFGADLNFPTFPAYSPTTQLASSFVDQGYRPPITQQFGANLQTEIARDLMLEVGYAGSRGTHQILNRSLNQALIASSSNPVRGITTNTVANIAQRVPIEGFTAPGLNDIDSSASSWYHGLEVSLTKRLSHGVQFLAAYTYAHAYSTSGRSTAAGGTSGITGDQNNKMANYGPSEFDREHRLVVSFLYQLPGPHGNALLRRAFGGWMASGVLTLQSGVPLTLTGTNGSNIAGITSDRAYMAPGCTYQDLSTPGSVHSKLNNYFARNCIYRSAAGAAIWPAIGSDGVATAFGNSGVGIVSGPDQRNFDLSAIKRTRVPGLGEAGNLEFRAEFFNAFNTTQFSSPGTNVSASTFGVISSTSVSPRIVQLALKLNF
jgi:hypothetical protein